MKKRLLQLGFLKIKILIIKNPTLRGSLARPAAFDVTCLQSGSSWLLCLSRRGGAFVCLVWASGQATGRFVERRPGRRKASCLLARSSGQPGAAGLPSGCFVEQQTQGEKTKAGAALSAATAGPPASVRKTNQLQPLP